MGSETPLLAPLDPIDPSERERGVDRRVLLGAAGLIGMAAMTRLAQAGPITPPAGPVGSTPPFEAQTAINDANTPGDGANYRYRITQPGNYYLTGAITTSFGRAIQVEADTVIIDLRGFAITNSDFGGIAILVSGIRTNLTIRNGTLSALGGCINVSLSQELDGLFLKDLLFLCGDINTYGISFYVRRLYAENCHFVGQGSTGASYATNLWGGGVLIGCTARKLARGFSVSSGSVLTECVARNCGTSFDVPGSLIERCHSYSATGVAYSMSGSVARGCVADGGGSHGFGVGSACVLEDCLSYSGTGNGFFLNVAAHTKLINCTSIGNTQHGMQSSGSSEGLTVRGCSFSRNSLSGIQTDTGCPGSLFEGNILRKNTQYGAFLAGPAGCTVRGNTVSGNGFHGLWLGGLTDGSVVENNTIQGNATAGAYDGLRVEANDVVIRGNSISGHTTAGAVGYRLTAIRNTFVSNFVSNNTTSGSANLANHVFGPIVTGLGTVSSTNPWANFQN
jgi:parallel beta-helix repeat protein